MSKIVKWANGLQGLTEAGAMLFINGELWEQPLTWSIHEHKVTVTSGRCTQQLWDRDDGSTEDEAMADWRGGRLLVLVDATPNLISTDE